MTLLPQRPDCGCYAQRKWRSGQPVLADELAAVTVAAENACAASCKALAVAGE